MIRCLTLLVFSSLFATAQEPFPLRDAVECSPRNGLPNVRQKIQSGSEVKIAYLGGSITAAPGWRIKSRKWLAEKYPNASFTEIHAAIGGTGSDLGVFRLQNDVLRHHPDLLFVEFAVNDGGASPERIHKAMEGIIRQTRRSNPLIDICLVYTLKEQMLSDLQAGKMPRAASAMEVLADHYGIPSIHFGVKVAAMAKEGELIFKAPKPTTLEANSPMIFSSDGVHPHIETGHQLYLEAIARSWPDIWSTNREPGPHSIPAPVRADNWEKAKQIPINQSMLKGDWTRLSPEALLSKRFKRNMPQLFKANHPGACLEFKFTGTTAAVFDLLGPDGGQLSLQLGQNKPRKVKKIDGYCTYHRMSKTQIATEIEPGVHQVSITLTGDQLDKREILFEKNRSFFDQHQDRYRDHCWYVSSLLVIGDLVE